MLNDVVLSNREIHTIIFFGKKQLVVRKYVDVKKLRSSLLSIDSSPKEQLHSFLCRLKYFSVLFCMRFAFFYKNQVIWIKVCWCVMRPNCVSTILQQKDGVSTFYRCCRQTSHTFGGCLANVIFRCRVQLLYV